MSRTHLNVRLTFELPVENERLSSTCRRVKLLLPLTSLGPLIPVALCVHTVCQQPPGASGTPAVDLGLPLTLQKLSPPVVSPSYWFLGHSMCPWVPLLKLTSSFAGTMDMCAPVTCCHEGPHLLLCKPLCAQKRDPHAGGLQKSSETTVIMGGFCISIETFGRF